MLPPGTVLVVLAAELPDARDPMTMPPPVGRDAARDITPPPVQHRANATAAAPQTPLARVAAVRAEHGNDAALKLREWNEEVRISIRELRRAIKSGALTAGRKPDGRDNKALTVTVGEMEAYLRTVDAVERGLMERPVWWTEVRGGQAAA